MSEEIDQEKAPEDDLIRDNLELLKTIDVFLCDIKERHPELRD